MTRRFRWRRPVGDATVTVTRVAGGHDDRDGDADRQRQYMLSVQADTHDQTLAVTRLSDSTDYEYTTADGHWVTVHEGAGFPRVRLDVAGERTLVRLPGPAFDDRLAAALDGDREAGGQLLDELGGPVATVVGCGPFLDADGFVALVGSLAAASGAASEALHAARYDLVRVAATTPVGPTIDSAAEFEAVVDGLNAVDAIGDVDELDALGDLIVVAHDSAGETRAFLDALGYDLPSLVDREDGRFFAYYLAQVASTSGVHEANQQAARRASVSEHPDIETATAAAERADYWERDDAWRSAVLPAALESRRTFAYALANALYWTGEVGRSDSRADELCYEGASAAGATIDLDWIVGHAAYERYRAAAHRHRSARNHALALAQFGAARELADEYSFLDPWEPTYSAAIVRSNQLSAAGRHEQAVTVLDETLEELHAQAVPESRFEEMRDHLVGQRHERHAKLATDEDDRLGHLEVAVGHYEAVGFDRSIDRIERKLDRGADQPASGQGGTSETEPVPRPVLRPTGSSGPSLEDIPELHDFLTDTDTTAVGSPDPGVLPDEQHEEIELVDGEPRDSDPRYR